MVPGLPVIHVAFDVDPFRLGQQYGTLRPEHDLPPLTSYQVHSSDLPQKNMTTGLLLEHIEKEDEILYSLADSRLDEMTDRKLVEEFHRFMEEVRKSYGS